MDKTSRILQLNEAINEGPKWEKKHAKFKRGETVIVVFSRKKSEEDWVGKQVRIMAEDETEIKHTDDGGKISYWSYYIRMDREEIHVPEDQLARPHEKMAKDTMNAVSKALDKIFGKRKSK